MKFVFLCVLFAAFVAVLYGASVQPLEEHAENKPIEKRDELAETLRDLFKSKKIDGEKRNPQAVDAATTGNAEAGQTTIENEKENEPSARRQKTARRLKSPTARRQFSALTKKQASQKRGKMTEALKKSVGTGDLKEKLSRRILINKKNRLAKKGQKTHDPSAASNKRTLKSPSKQQKSPNNRAMSQKKRQYPGSPLTCSYCETVINGNPVYYDTSAYPDPPSYYGNYGNYGNYDDYQWNYMDDSPAYYYNYDYMNEWGQCYDMIYMYGSCNGGSTQTCEVPCQSEYGGDFYLCFISEIYFMNYDMMYMYSDGQCRMKKLMQELNSRLGIDFMYTDMSTDPYMDPATDPYMDPATDPHMDPASDPYMDPYYYIKKK